MTVRRSGIGYADFSGGDANFIIGCRPDESTSPACTHCYARELIQTRQGRDFSKVRLYPEKLARLARSKFKENGTPFRRGPGSRPIVFPVDLGDIMHQDVPHLFIEIALDTMAQRDDADWLILTKRPARLLEFYPNGWPPNIWPGVTVESQDYTWRIEHLRQVKASVRWLSIEPMLEAIRLSGYLECGICGSKEWNFVQFQTAHLHNRGMDWIVLGAESGSKRRPFDENWARDMRNQCQNAGVAFHYKQDSHRFPGRNDILDGRTWKEFPR